jgi:hypothetical protein
MFHTTPSASPSEPSEIAVLEAEREGAERQEAEREEAEREEAEREGAEREEVLMSIRRLL